MNKYASPVLWADADKEAPYGRLETYLREIIGANLQINTWYGAKRKWKKPLQDLIADKHKSL